MIKAENVFLITTKNAKVSILRNNKDHCSWMHLRKSVGASVTGSVLLQFRLWRELVGSEIPQRSCRGLNFLIVDPDFSTEPENL
jgi:hypothetical protein